MKSLLCFALMTLVACTPGSLSIPNFTGNLPESESRGDGHASGGLSATDAYIPFEKSSPALFDRIRNKLTDTGDYSVKNGIITGPNVKTQLSNRFTSRRGFSGGKPRGIILHKTAGRSCASGEKIPVAYRKPHIYICRNGTVIVNGSLDAPRTAVEAGHNDWTLSIEFEAAYAPKSTCKGDKPQNGIHCYENLTEQQKSVGHNMVKLMGKYHGIPIKPLLKYNSRQEYYAASTRVLDKPNRGAYKGDPSLTGVGSSIQFVKKGNNNEHDDYLEFEEFNQVMGGPSEEYLI